MERQYSTDPSSVQTVWLLQMPGATPLILFHTSACHLCELAQALLHAQGIDHEPVDIAGDDALVERYGVRIPVVRRPDGAELGWPFDARRLADFLAAATDAAG